MPTADTSTRTASRETAYAGASAEAIQHHYDVGDDRFWRMWLGPSLTYSCALWEPGDTLDTAQQRKLDYMIDGARLAGAERMLDVGCGWGSLLRRGVDRGVERAVGLTLSEVQHDWIAGWADPRVEVHLAGWSEYRPDAPFDGIVSVGAFEHFARHGLTREEKIESYREFFERCRGWLRPGGRMALQTIAKGDVPVDRQGMRDIVLIVRRMFPESDLPHPAEVVLGMEGKFELLSVRNDRDHYARTCDAWLQALRSRREEAVTLVGEPLVATYEQYLAACVRQFERGHAVLLRILMRRLDDRRQPLFGRGTA